MKFKFEGKPVSVVDGVITCDNDIKVVLAPLLKVATGGPEHGDPFINLVRESFGVESVTNIELDDLIY